MRRRRVSLVTNNYDSVLDMMANVTAVFIVIVAVTKLTGIGVSLGPPAHHEAPDEHSDHDQATVASLRSELDDVASSLALLRERLGVVAPAAPPSENAPVDVRSSIVALAHEVDRSTQVEEDSQVLREQIRRAEARLAQIDHEAALRQDKVAALESHLDQLHDAPPPAASEVRIPLPDLDAVGKLQQEFFLCQGGRVYCGRGIADPLGEGLAAAAISVGAKYPPSGPEDWRKTRDAVAQHFQAHYVGIEGLRLQAAPCESLSESGQTMLDIAWTFVPQPEGACATVESLREPGNRLSALLQTLDPKQHWLLFLTWDDSFDVYVAARRLAESKGFRVGWIPYGSGEQYSERLFARAGDRRTSPD